MRETSNPLAFWPVLAGSTFLSTPGVKGLIVENRTGKPVEGAHVYALWKRHLRNTGGHILEETAKKIGLVTPEDGCFEIPPYFLFNPAPGVRGHAGSFAFMVYAERFKVRLYTFRDPESLTSYESCDWKELALFSNGERMTIRLSRISEPLTEPACMNEFGSLPALNRPEAATVPSGPANGESAADDFPAGAETPPGPPCKPVPQPGDTRERIMRARKLLVENSKRD